MDDRHVTMQKRAPGRIRHRGYYNGRRETAARYSLRKSLNLASSTNPISSRGNAARARGFMTDRGEADSHIWQAIEAFRAVHTKDYVIPAQKERIAQFNELRKPKPARRGTCLLPEVQARARQGAEKLAQIHGGRIKQSRRIKCGHLFFRTEGWMRRACCFLYGQRGLTRPARRRR